MHPETARRRTFAIISHPDAGKTTLTEKLLLYGGALDLAGSVTAKKQQRETASDWMELEKKRGISISSTVLQFEYDGYRLNLLDTPGHKDFSEDTYRVLMAVDAVVMVIDAGKGIESQTRKLFEICRKRGIPIFTFMNKLDREAMPPLELIDQLEKVLNLHAFPMNWPLGCGKEFKGVYDRMRKQVSLFERVPGGAFRAPVSVHGISDPSVKEKLDEHVYAAVTEELELLDGAQGDFDIEAVRKGLSTPVFFGSAANNFGVEAMLKGFLEHSMPPSPRYANTGLIDLDDKHFSAFVFKVQTNMNPKHRDRMVFIRVCSGKFSRDMNATNTRTGENMRLTSSHTVFGREREIVVEGYPGDVIGFVTKADLRIGDTLSTEQGRVFEAIPRFAPECFAFLHNPVVSNYKSFRKGVDHLLSEDIVQQFTLKDRPNTTPLLGAVGPLQFEVLQYRMKDEYGAETQLETLPWSVMRWVNCLMDEIATKYTIPYDVTIGADDLGRSVLFFPSEWSKTYFAGKNPELVLHDTPSAILRT